MRLNAILLVAAAALFASCDAVSTASQTKLSAMNPPNAVQSMGVAPYKRLLRSESQKQTDADDSEEEEEEEERALVKVGLLDDAVKKVSGVDDAAAQKLAALKIKQQNEADDITFLAKFWMQQRKMPSDIEKLTQNPVVKKANLEFLALFLKQNPKQIRAEAARVQQRIDNADPKVRFLVSSWIFQNKKPEDISMLASNAVSKEAADLFNVQYVIRSLMSTK
ncbi:hypothetical protein PPTG_15196 [Phytophthora nicotianae INRA-310]|uniref:RxLR effector protein n=2 Tax=Phytophthora nicotianae TaxID=4792 RepID=W2PUJ4_PHYN3|nr:hypothetical protein PPTG_15196 [Phytophthora nicotianae INRA-310]KUF81790.1 hypothetical protein AM587_10000933 [Phytophthora nicotianae]ETN03874.1 hypothetical protein PPTG_15196 [Phytophthora nicotianae INRA-310]KUF83824.1 hypothetical protein AM587_10001277 [Phytophthora nicotianae]KUF88221.1 GTP-binding protein ypt2 [Phytophthora nicotianae]KUF94304.1 hypothetical protein AM587_10000909 [Phytophthora nicotianae]